MDKLIGKLRKARYVARPWGRVMTEAMVAGAILSMTSCSGPAPQADAVGRMPQASPQPASQMQPSPRDVPLVYQQRIVPEPLSPAQVQEALDRAASVTPPGRKVWFIQVRTNHTDPKDSEWSVLVFFTPDVATARVRKGKYILVGDTPWSRLANRLAEKEGSAGKKPLPILVEYVQVSDSAKPFGDTLAMPEVTLLPFAQPDGFTDSEMVEIVDLARTAKPPTHSAPVQGEAGEEESALEPLGWPEGNEPILRIQRKGGVIRVKVGWYEGPLSAGGHYIELKRVNGRLQVVNAGMWVS